MCVWMSLPLCADDQGCRCSLARTQTKTLEERKVYICGDGERAVGGGGGAGDVSQRRGRKSASAKRVGLAQGGARWLETSSEM